jgi:hypothetical protein
LCMPNKLAFGEMVPNDRTTRVLLAAHGVMPGVGRKQKKA